MAVFAGAAVALAVAGLGPLVLVAVAVLLVVCYLKGTAPGGPAAWREFRGPDPPRPPPAPDISIENVADRFHHLRDPDR